MMLLMAIWLLGIWLRNQLISRHSHSNDIISSIKVGTGSTVLSNIVVYIIHGNMWGSNVCSAKMFAMVELRNQQPIINSRKVNTDK